MKREARKNEPFFRLRVNGGCALALMCITLSPGAARAEQYDGCASDEVIMADDADPTKDVKLGSLSEEQVKDFLARQATLGVCGPWYSSMSLGAQFLPEYTEEGASSGFSEQRFFGQLRAEGRWNRWNAGIHVTFRGAPVVRNAESTPGVVPREFNDIADTIITGPYVSWSFHHFDRATVSRKVGRVSTPGQPPVEHDPMPRSVDLSIVSAVLRINAISRERLDTNEDSVDANVSLGLSYRYDDFRRLGYRTGLSRGYATVSAAWFEDYAELGSKTRAVVDAAYRVFDTMPVYVGVSGNFGSGPDEIALYVAYSFKSQKIVDFF